MSTSAPLKPIASHDVPWSEWADVPNFAVRYMHLSIAALGEAYHVGVALEELAPGKQSAPFHYHFLEEEHVYLLEGTLTVRLGSERYEMKPGDYVCFPAGQTVGHSFLNSGNGPCSYLVIGERSAHDVCVYPDSNKLAVNALNVRESIFDRAALRNYWDGEQTG